MNLIKKAEYEDFIRKSGKPPVYVSSEGVMIFIIASLSKNQS